MPTNTAPDLCRLTVSMPFELRAALSAYAASRDASLGWVLRRGARLLLDEEREQAARLSSPRVASQRDGGGPTTTISVRVPMSLRDELRAEAARRGDSVNSVARDRLTR
jgi:hypothetical protein